MSIITSNSTPTWLFSYSVPSLSPSSPYSSIKIVKSLTLLDIVDAPFAVGELGRKRRRRKWGAIDESGEKQSVTVASPTTENFDDDDSTVDSASAVVRNFYGGINAHDVDSVQYLIADNCVYEDLVFPQPFVGRKEILEFFKKFTNSTSKDLQFVIDDLSTKDPSSVGVIWHLEWKGKPFPFSKGCSFYRLEVINGRRQITYGRDCVEPAIKPGDATLTAIRSVTWLLQQFPQLAKWF
ncbi:uncharacterized protein LOC124843325 [Vigna umbellata]|uniref:uncharacterized protein LOC124843325 n=1 Tax=Vigna umbellata TaxID=87088 RepID=UPI001F5ECF43|nr:uncharacterized protein LOC124843325 [Vigna umbellata]